MWKRCFVEVVVNCVAAACVSIKPWMLVVQGISQRLLQASLDGTVCIHTQQFQQTPKPELWMKIKHFNESHSHWDEVVLVMLMVDDDYRTKF